MTQEHQNDPEPHDEFTGEDQPHKPADDTEEIYFEGSPLLRGELLFFLSWTVIGMLIMSVPFIIRGSGYEWPQWWVTLGMIILGAIAILVPIIRTRTVRYRISNYRIDFERGILTKKIDTLELWHVEDISFEQSITDRMLKVGTIKIISHDDTTPLLLLQGIPDPRPIFETLKQRVIAVKRQRGVVKMDMGS